MERLNIVKRKKVNIIFYIVLIILIIIFLSFLDSNKYEYNYVISIIENSLIYAVVALSMNIVTGFTGLFSLGQAGFMAIGAYTTAILTIPIASRANVYYMNGISPVLENLILPIPVAIIIGGVIAGLFAFLIGIPVLRLKSDYLAIATLGFAEIIRAVIASPMMDKVTNGSYGLKNIPAFKGSVECFIYCLICIVIMVLIITSTHGKDFKAIREDEIAARAVGINIFKMKEMSFVISSFFTGVGGGLLAMFMRSIDSKTFSLTLTYDILLIVVLGGIGSITGSIIGSFFVNAGKELLRIFDAPLEIFNTTIDGIHIGNINIEIFKSGLRMVIFSILLMVVVLFFRKGLIGGKELDIGKIINYFIDKKNKKLSEGGAKNE